VLLPGLRMRQMATTETASSSVNWLPIVMAIAFLIAVLWATREKGE